MFRFIICTTMVYVDLHMHTNFSDGRPTPEILVKENAILGLDAIAITDHDTMASYEQAKTAAQRWGLQLIPGVEVTTHDYDILGLNVNPYDKQFQGFLDYSKGLQEAIQEQRIVFLQNHGIPISMEKVREYNPGAKIGRFNIALTIMQDPESRAFLSQYTNNEIYSVVLKQKGLNDDVDSTHQAGAQETIDAIHRAGGIAIVAHPFKQAKRPQQLDELVMMGLDGLEIQPNYGESNHPFEAYARTKGLMITFGSDCHGLSNQQRPLLGRNYQMEPFWETKYSKVV